MDDTNNTTGSDEDMLTYTVSDEALEAATGFGAGPLAAAQTYWGLSVLCYEEVDTSEASRSRLRLIWKRGAW
jgi:hypothetical protein